MRYCTRPGAEQFSVRLGWAVIVVIYACVITCGRSFTVLSDWGILISFWVVLVFSPTLLSLLLLLPYYYCHYCKLLLLLVITVIIIISTELLALCDGCLGWGWFPLSSKICDLGIIWSNLASTHANSRGSL